MANPGESVGHNLDELGCRRQPETESSSRNVWFEDSLEFEVHGAYVQRRRISLGKRCEIMECSWTISNLERSCPPQCWHMQQLHWQCVCFEGKFMRTSARWLPTQTMSQDLWSSGLILGTSVCVHLGNKAISQIRSAVVDESCTTFRDSCQSSKWTTYSGTRISLSFLKCLWNKWQ